MPLSKCRVGCTRLVSSVQARPRAKSSHSPVPVNPVWPMVSAVQWSPPDQPMEGRSQPCVRLSLSGVRINPSAGVSRSNPCAKSSSDAAVPNRPACPEPCSAKQFSSCTSPQTTRPRHGSCSVAAARAGSADPKAPLVPVAKKSTGGKTSVGGRKWAARRLDADGVAEAEVVGTGEVPAELVDQQLLTELVKSGQVVAREPLDASRARHATAKANLPLSATQLSRGEAVLPTEYVQGRSGS